MSPARPTRRRALAGLVGLALGAGPARAAPGGRAPGRGPEALAVRAVPIKHFEVRDPARRRFGALTFLGGLELTAPHPAFGGLSGLRVRPDGRFLAVTDRGHWLSGRLPVDAAGAPQGVEDAVIAPVIGPGGRPLPGGPLGDAEALAVGPDGATYLAVERAHAVLRFAPPGPASPGVWGGDLAAPGRALPLPEEARRLPRNKGLEALGVVPRGPHAGRLLAVAERSEGGDAEAEAGGPSALTRAFLLAAAPGDARPPEALWVARRPPPGADAFEVTDLDFDEDGALVLLERSYSRRRGVALRLRRVPPAALRPGATLDGEDLLRGEELLVADMAFQVDNMEALSLHRDPAGRRVMTLLSDDNFSWFQRTVLLRFALD